MVWSTLVEIHVVNSVALDEFFQHMLKCMFVSSLAC